MAASALVDAGFLVALLSRRVAVSQATQPDHVRGSANFVALLIRSELLHFGDSSCRALGYARAGHGSGRICLMCI
jgi:hypothetical protein